MKKISGIIISILLLDLAQAQPGCPAVNAGPDVIMPCGQSCTTLNATAFAAAQTTAYTVNQIAYNPPFSYTSGTSILVAIDDTWGPVINLPFNFCFFGNVYNKIIVGSNGVISFNTGNTGLFNTWTISGPIPSAAPADLTNCIMGPWEDIDPTYVGDIRYQISGTYPCRMFEVSWEGVSYYGDPNSVYTDVNPALCGARYATYQTVIYETTNAIEVYIQNKDVCPGWNSGLAIEGIQNAAGTIAYTVPGRNATQWTAQNDAWRFTPAGAPNYTIRWFDGATQIGTGNSVSVCPPNSKSYTAQATYTNCDASTVVVNDNVFVGISGISIQIDSVHNVRCNGESNGAVYASYSSTGSAVLSYGWSAGGANQTSLTNIPAGTYIFSVTDATNCTRYDTVVLPNPPPLTAAISPATISICNGDNTSLTASGGGTYIWNTGATTASINISPASTTSYTVTVTNATGCTASASRTVTVNQKPTVSISPPGTLTCTLTSVTLSTTSSPAGVTYSWSGGGTISTKIISTPGNYSVTVTDPGNGCTASASVAVAQNIVLPTVNITPPATLTCAVTSVTLTTTASPAGVTYSWSGGGTISTKIISTPGNYSVTVTDPANGCSASASVTVAQNIALPTVNINPPPTLTCAVASVTLTTTASPAGVTYSWSSGGSASSASVAAPGSYSVTVTDPSNGCSASASVTVAQDIVLPTVSINPPATLTCAVTSVTLTTTAAPVGVTYSWSSGGSASTKVVLSPGNYSVTVTDPANGCTASASVSVSQSGAIPNVSIAAPAILTCLVTTVTLTASSTTPGVTYNWGGGITTPTNAISTGGTYSVTVTDPSNGCMASASVTVIQNIVLPTVSINPPATLTCAVTSVTLSTTSSPAGVTYSWSSGGNASSASVSIPGNYSVTVTDPANGCSASASVAVAQNIVLPTVSINPPATLTCAVTSVTLSTTSSPAGVTYQWSSGGTGSSALVAAPGNYSVTVTDPANGCSASTSVAVAQNITLPTVNITPPATLTCAITSVTLTANAAPAGVTYSWSGGETISTKNISAPGSYSVTVTDPSNGCSASTSVTVTQDIALPTVNINPPATLTCVVTSVTLSTTASPAGVTYNWSNGGSVSSTSVAAPSNYSVTVTDPANSCSASASVAVAQNIILPTISINPPATLTCAVTSVTLSTTSSPAGVTYSWNSGGSVSSTSVAAPGNYSVTVTDPANGCSASASVTVAQNITLPTVNITPPATLTCAVTSVTLSTTSSPAGVTYSWSSGGTASSASVAAPGNYSVTVTNPANGCTASASVTVAQNITLPTVNITPPATLTCAVTSVTLSTTSSPAGVTYSWSGGGTISTKNISTPGNYSVTVTDPSNGCSASTSVTVAQDVAVPTVNINPPATLTCVVTSVALSTNASPAGVTYSWSNGGTASTKVVSSPGNYSVTVTDPSNGCSASTSVTVAQDVAVPTVNINPPATLTCVVTSVTLSTNASPAGVTYSWSSGGSASSTSVSAPGNYSVTVTDPANGCSASASVTVIQNITLPTVSINPPATLTCAVTSVTLSTTASPAGVTYSWSSGGSVSSTSVATAGNYSVMITDPANGCSASTSVTVAQDIAVPTVNINPPATLTCVVTSVTLSTTASPAGVTYNWSNGGTASSSSVSASGNYSVTVTNPSNGCTASASVSVSQSGAIPNVSIAAPATLTCLVTTVTLTASSTTPGVTYNWSGGITTPTNTISTGGTYSVTVTDPSNGCMSSASVTVIQNIILPTVSINPPATLTCAVTSVTLSTTASPASVTYSWSSGVSSSSTSVTTSGNYSVIVTDPANGCTASASVAVAQNIVLPTVSINPPATLTCAVTSLTLSTTASPAGVTYSWSSGGSASSASVAAPGNYSVTVTDPANGCSASASVTVAQNINLPTVSINPPATLTCAVTSVTLTANATPAGVTYSWSSGGIASSASVSIPGNYSVTVTDPANGCSASASVTVAQNINLPTVSINPPATLTCAVTSVTLSTTASPAGVTYSWSSGGIASSASVSIPGNYSVTVTDPANGCSASASVTVAQNINLPTVSINPPATLTCAVTSVTLSTTASPAGVTYSWSSGGIASTKVVSSPGNYPVTVTDPANGCSASASVAVAQNIVLPTVSINPPATLTCVVTSVTLSTTSSPAGVTYSWSSGGIASTKVVSSPGNYSVTVTDPANGCSASASVTVIQNITLPTVSINPPATLTCAVTSVTLSTTASPAGVTYSWSSGGSVSSTSVATAGNYSVMITDPANGCSASTSVTVAQDIAVPTVNINPPATLTCVVTSVTLSTTASPAGVTYNWSNGGTASSSSVSASGNYSVTVTNPSNGCTASASVTVVQSVTPPTVSINPPMDLTCTVINQTLTTIAAPVSVTYLWSGGGTTSTKIISAPGNYSVTVTDPGNGCTASAATTVNSVSSIVLTSTHINILCAGGNAGYIDLTIAGGMMPYTILWNNGNTNEDLTGITAGTYTVGVTDNVGCVANTSVTITEPSALQITDLVSNVSCFGLNDASINLTVSGGTTLYNYSWNDAVVTEDRNNLSAGSYSVTVTDNNLCSASLNINILQPTALNVIETHMNVLCNGANTGAINVTSSGGTLPYSYLWNDAIVTEDRSNLLSGNYSVTVTDNNLCSSYMSINIAQPTALTTSETHTDILCNGVNSGSINITSTGGTVPYSFLWNDGNTLQNQINLAAGNYSVTVNDNNSCSSSLSIAITQPTALNVIETHINLLCNGANTGSISISSSGGISPYSYLWNDANTSQTRNNITAGSYSITVNDNNSCSSSLNIVITEPAALNITETHVNVACNGGNNGSVDITSSGGIAPYTYLWNDGTISEDRSNLVLGNYFLTVTDNNSCSSSINVVIGSNSGIVVTETHTDISCFGGNNANISVTVSGGQSPYTYLWNDGAVTPNRTNIFAGSYTLYVTDNNLCVQLLSVNILQPVALNISGTPLNVLCNAGNTGSINITASGGTSPLTFNWSDGITTQNRPNLTAGNYSVTVSDNNLCSSSVSVSVTEPVALSLSETHTNILCNGAGTGSIDIIYSGGTSPSTFIWNDGMTTQNRTNLFAVNYSVTVSDNNLCSASISVIITEPAALNISETHTDVACGGATPGSINTSITGGISPYTYFWNDAVITPNRNNLSAGNYTVTVRDNNGCTSSLSVTINVGSGLNINETHSMVSCNGGSNATIGIASTGGTSPYTFAWNDGNTAQSRNNLTIGTYSVTAYDAGSCSASVSVNITSPPAFSVTAVRNNVLCNGGNIGSIVISPSGGTSPYTYLWNDGTPTQNRSFLAAGTYSLTVTDNNSCTFSITTLITQPALLSVVETHSDILCNGANNGSINLSTNGGTSSYTYVWNDTDTSQNRNNLSAANYTVTVTDNNNCSTSLTVVISEPTVLSVSETHMDVLCNAASTGSINITAAGGTSPVTFVWNDGNTFAVRNNLAAGTYSVTVSDNNSCSSVLSVPITEPAALNVSETHTNILCNAAVTGSINITTSGGTSPISFTWNDSNTSSVRNNISAGNYSVTVSDNNSCSSVLSVPITEPPAIVVTETHVNVACSGGTGSINITSSGGVSPITYLWNDAVITEDRINIAPGNYSITVSDNNACSSSMNIIIGSNSGIVITETHTNISCFGGTNATITTNVTGGVSPYNYIWNDAVIAPNRANITAGLYTLSVTDNNSCVQVLNVTITQPPAITLAETHVTVSCNGGNTGSINITASGGTSPYTFIWNDGIASQNRTNLLAGNYSVTTNDSNTCSASMNVSITEPAAVVVSETHLNILCNGGNNGSINIAVAGGISPYSFVWNDGSILQNRANLAPGNYSVTVNDNNSCPSSRNIILTEPSAIVVTETHTDANCHGGSDASISISVSGGTTPYAFVWNDGNTLQNRVNISAGVYSVTVKDNNLCSAAQSGIIITEPTAITVSATHTDVTCHGYNNGDITVSVSGGTPSYTFVWNDAVTSQNRANLLAGNYSVTVNDSHSCPAAVNVIITEPSGMTLTTSFVDPTCSSNANDGSMTVQVSGGAVPYTYDWSNGSTTNSIIHAAPGSYVVTVTDANGCEMIAPPFVLAYQYNFSVDASPSVTVDYGESTTLSYTITGNAGNYTNVWTPSATLSCSNCAAPEASPTSTTTYQILITNEAGCSAVDHTTVYVEIDHTIFVPNVFTPNGDGNNDFFEVYGKLKSLAYLEMQVFNRWGEKVFDSNDHHFKWDGTFKGVMQEPAVFVWQLKLGFIDGIKEDIRVGSVTLVR